MSFNFSNVYFSELDKTLMKYSWEKSSI